MDFLYWPYLFSSKDVVRQEDFLSSEVINDRGLCCALLLNSATHNSSFKEVFKVKRQNTANHLQAHFLIPLYRSVISNVVT